MKPASSTKETGWLPDFTYTGDKFEAGLAFFADELGRISRFSREPADLAVARRLEGQAAMPGLVNGHSQALRRLDRGRTSMIDVASLTEDDVYDAARMAFLEMLLSGITCVGDVGTLPNLSLTAVHEVMRAGREVGIRLAYFHGAVNAGELVPQMEALRSHVAIECPGDGTWLGVSVPSLEGISAADLKEIAAHAHAHRYRLQIQLPRRPDVAAGFVARHGGSPVALLAGQGLLDKRVTVIHAGSISEDDAKLLGAARALVCVCPNVVVVAGEPPADIVGLRAAGADVAIGTNEQGRSNLLEAVRGLTDAGGAAARLHAATVAGARSLGAPSGALEVGRPADFFTVNLYDPSIAGASPEGFLNAIMFAGERRAIREVWVGARPRVTNGRHLQQGPIVGRFVELQRRRANIP